MRQLCFWLTLLAGVGMTVIAVPSPAAEKKTDEAAIKKLVDQLGSDDFSERETAQKELAKIGMPAYEYLKKTLADPKCDPEVQQRAVGILERLDRELITTKVLTPTKVTLKYKDTPIKEAVADFAKKAGCTIELFDPKDALKLKTVTLDTGEVTFWEAFDQFCEASGLTETTLAEVMQEVQKQGQGGQGKPGAQGGGGGAVQPGVIQIRPIRAVPVKPVEAKPVEDKPVEKKEIEKKEARPVEKDSDEPQTSSCGDNDTDDAKKKAEDEKKQAEQKEVAKKQAQAKQIQVQAVQQIQIQVGPGGAIAPGGPGMPGGIQLPFAADTQIILKEGKHDKSTTSYSGSMRVKTIKEPATILGPVDPKQYLVGLQVSAEPKLQIASLLDVKVTKAVDDQDQTLRALPAEGTDDGGIAVWGGPARGRGRIVVGGPFPGQMGNGNQPLPVKLVKGVKEAKTLKELSGTVTAQVLMSPEQMMEATDIRKSSGKTFNGKETGYIKILGVTENNGQLTLRVEYEAPKDVLPVYGNNNQFGNVWGKQGGFGGQLPPPPQAPGATDDAKTPARPRTVTELAQYGLTLVDEKGKPLACRNISVGGRWMPNGTVVNEYHMTWAIDKDTVPSKLVFSGQRSATVDVPFSFKNVAVK